MRSSRALKWVFLLLVAAWPDGAPAIRVRKSDTVAAKAARSARRGALRRDIVATSALQDKADDLATERATTQERLVTWGAGTTRLRDRGGGNANATATASVAAVAVEDMLSVMWSATPRSLVALRQKVRAYELGRQLESRLEPMITNRALLVFLLAWVFITPCCFCGCMALCVMRTIDNHEDDEPCSPRMENAETAREEGGSTPPRHSGVREQLKDLGRTLFSRVSTLSNGSSASPLAKASLRINATNDGLVAGLRGVAADDRSRQSSPGPNSMRHHHSSPLSGNQTGNNFRTAQPMSPQVSTTASGPVGWRHDYGKRLETPAEESSTGGEMSSSTSHNDRKLTSQRSRGAERVSS